MSADVHAAVAEVWKRESATVIAVACRIVRDLGLAEELAQDALIAALEEWPRTGLPARPGAWLVTTARNRALNTVQHHRMADRKHDALRHEAPASVEDLEARMDDDVGDDVLRLVFTACHPVLSRDARVALTLRLICGLSTEEIARAFLVPEPTIAQRIVRARKTLGQAGLPFEVPRGEALGPRLASVLEVVYLVFNEGHTASAGDVLVRQPLVDEALRLGRRLSELAPAEPEVHGLLALMELTASRAATRVDADGDPVLLTHQDRSRWDRALIASGTASLACAEALRGAAPGSAGPLGGGAPAGPYELQAAIAACHATPSSVEDTDWKRIASLYGELLALQPSPVVALNRAMAISRVEGPDAGLALLDALAASGALKRYPFLPAARAELLEPLGRHEEARAAFEQAAALTGNERQRRRLLARAAACDQGAQVRNGSDSGKSPSGTDE